MSDYIPKVGEVCEIKHKNTAPDWAQPDFYPATIKAMGDELMIIKSGSLYTSSNESVARISDYYFRPIKSARDKAIDEMMRLTRNSIGSCAYAYDAGYRKIKPISEQDFIEACIEDFGLSGTYTRMVNLSHIVSE